MKQEENLDRDRRDNWNK